MLPTASHERLPAPPDRREVKIGQNGMPTFALSYDAWKNSTLPDYRYELDMPVLQYFSKFPTRSDAVATLTNAAESPPISPRIPEPALLWKAPPPSFKKSSMPSAPQVASHVAPFKAPWVPKNTQVAPPPVASHVAPFKAPWVPKQTQVAPPTSNATPAPFKAPFVSKSSGPGPSKAAPFKAPPPSIAAMSLTKRKQMLEKLREEGEKEKKMEKEREIEMEKEREIEKEKEKEKKKKMEKEREIEMEKEREIEKEKEKKKERDCNNEQNDKWRTDKSVMEKDWNHRREDNWRNNIASSSCGTWQRQENNGGKQYWEANKWSWNKSDWSNEKGASKDGGRWGRWRNSKSTTSAVHQNWDDGKSYGQRDWWSRNKNIENWSDWSLSGEYAKEEKWWVA